MNFISLAWLEDDERPSLKRVWQVLQLLMMSEVATFGGANISGEPAIDIDDIAIPKLERENIDVTLNMLL